MLVCPEYIDPLIFKRSPFKYQIVSGLVSCCCSAQSGFQPNDPSFLAVSVLSDKDVSNLWRISDKSCGGNSNLSDTRSVARKPIHPEFTVQSFLQISRHVRSLYIDRCESSLTGLRSFLPGSTLSLGLDFSEFSWIPNPDPEKEQIILRESSNRVEGVDGLYGFLRMISMQYGYVVRSVYNIRSQPRSYYLAYCVDSDEKPVLTQLSYLSDDQTLVQLFPFSVSDLFLKLVSVHSGETMFFSVLHTVKHNSFELSKLLSSLEKSSQSKVSLLDLYMAKVNKTSNCKPCLTFSAESQPTARRSMFGVVLNQSQLSSISKVLRGALSSPCLSPEDLGFPSVSSARCLPMLSVSVRSPVGLSLCDFHPSEHSVVCQSCVRVYDLVLLPMSHNTSIVFHNVAADTRIVHKTDANMIRRPNQKLEFLEFIHSLECSHHSVLFPTVDKIVSSISFEDHG